MLGAVRGGLAGPGGRGVAKLSCRQVCGSHDLCKHAAPVHCLYTSHALCRLFSVGGVLCLELTTVFRSISAGGSLWLKHCRVHSQLYQKRTCAKIVVPILKVNFGPHSEPFSQSKRIQNHSNSQRLCLHFR